MSQCDGDDKDGNVNVKSRERPQEGRGSSNPVRFTLNPRTLEDTLQLVVVKIRCSQHLSEHPAGQSAPQE